MPKDCLSQSAPDALPSSKKTNMDASINMGFQLASAGSSAQALICSAFSNRCRLSQAEACQVRGRDVVFSRNM